MALHIKNPEAERLARAIARATGKTLAEVVIQSLRERLRRVQATGSPRLSEELLAIARRCAALPVLDRRSPDHLIGYDENGLPR